MMSPSREVLERLRGAECMLERVCTQLRFAELLGRDRSWAVIGGAVRDTVLSQNGEAQLPDIDIAVADVVPDLSPRYGQPAPNHFGGIKIALGTISLDVWSWVAPGRDRTSMEDWIGRLNGVDFGINAIAFLWPQRRIVWHERWLEDLSRRQVETLSIEDARPELRAIRALALLVKLRGLLHEEIACGAGVQASLTRLATLASPAEANRAVSYLIDKVSSGRWPDAVLTELVLLCREYGSRGSIWPVLEKSVARKQMRLV